MRSRATSDIRNTMWMRNGYARARWAGVMGGVPIKLVGMEKV